MKRSLWLSLFGFVAIGCAHQEPLPPLAFDTVKVSGLGEDKKASFTLPDYPTHSFVKKDIQHPAKLETANGTFIEVFGFDQNLSKERWDAVSFEASPLFERKEVKTKNRYRIELLITPDHVWKKISQGKIKPMTGQANILIERERDLKMVLDVTGKVDPTLLKEWVDRIAIVQERED